MVVGYDYFRLIEVAEHVRRDELAALVVSVRVVRLEDAQPVPDGDSGRDHEKAARESVAVGAADGVDGLPRYEHRHDGRLARAGGEFEGDSVESGVGFAVDAPQSLQYGAPVALAGGDFGEPDGGLRRLYLAEERAVVGEPMLAPVAQKAGGLRRDAPVVRVWDAPPSVHTAADVVHIGVAVVALAVAGCAEIRLKAHLPDAPPSARRRRGRDESSRPPRLVHARRGLPRRVQLPMARGIFVWRIEYRVFVEIGFHAGRPSPYSGGCARPYVLTRSFTRSSTDSVSSTRSSMISAAGRAWSIMPATCPAGLKIRSWRPAFSADWLKPDISVP